MGIRTTTRGRPGSTARRLARRRRLAAFAVAAAGTLVAAILVVAGLAIPAVVVIAVTWVTQRSLQAAAGRALAGARAEDLVARAIRRVRAEAVLFDVALPMRRGDLDVVLLGPMAAVVEVKLGSGRVRWFDDGRMKVGRTTLPGRPLHQVVSQAAALRRAIGGVGHVEAVLCVSGMRQRPRLVVVNGVEIWLTSARHLRRVVRRMPHILERKEANHLASWLG